MGKTKEDMTKRKWRENYLETYSMHGKGTKPQKEAQDCVRWMYMLLCINLSISRLLIMMVCLIALDNTIAV